MFAQEAVIDNDEAQKVVGSIFIEGNNRTKEYTILRELPFKMGDTLTVKQLNEEIKKAENNLFNTKLFTFTEIKPLYNYKENTPILISLKERWYIWPIPILDVAEPNFNTWLENKDFRRADYGLLLVQENFRGRNEKLELSARIGYSDRYGFRYLKPFFKKKQNVGFGFDFDFIENREITYGTSENKRLFFNLQNQNVQDNLEAKIELYLRNNIRTKHTFELKYTDSRTNDSLQFLTNDYYQNGKLNIQFFSLNYSFRVDNRNRIFYPLTGNFYKHIIQKNGLGITNELLDQISTEVEYKHYFQIKKNLYWAMGLKGKTNFHKNVPYFIQRALGYKDWVRGYEYYVIDGQHFGLLKTNFKYRLAGSEKSTIGFIKEQKFFNTFFYDLYLNLYSDIGYVKDDLYRQQNQLGNSLLFGYGMGLDFVFFYDIVFRVDLSVNRIGDKGVFLHFIQPI